jgi:large subunit ribosomal protein L17
MKAKELRSFAEKLITTARVADANSHRSIFAVLQNKEATKNLIGEVAPKYADRQGGYTRIIKTRIRRGDATPMATIELV